MRPLLVELCSEELPPRALQPLSLALAEGLRARLQAAGLLAEPSEVQVFATPRRLAVLLSPVRAQAPLRVVTHKLMPVPVALTADGQPTSALRKKLAALGLEASAVTHWRQVLEGKTEMLYGDVPQPGVSLEEGLQQALQDTLAKLPIPKVMSYPLADGWSCVHFVRPVRRLVALHGDEVVTVEALGLKSGRETLGHRFAAQHAVIRLRHAAGYAAQLETEGAVVASFAGRRARIVQQLRTAAAAAGTGLAPIEDPALLDEVTALVEWPQVLSCRFDEAFLEVPQECLILTMQTHQKYFPLLDAAGRLSHHFLVVANLSPRDPAAVIAGNERVVRARLADARFFYDQDRRQTLASRVPGLALVVYHHRLGTQAERVQRLASLAHGLAGRLGGEDLARQAEQTARLAKADLLTGMVGEFPELQGIMGRYYALHDGWPPEVAQAIEDHYKPRFAGDALPRSLLGLCLALADKLETLTGLFGIGQTPSGDKDPYALRRHALGVARILLEGSLPLRLDECLERASATFAGIAGFQPAQPGGALEDFLFERLAGLLREQGYSAPEVAAVLSLRPQRLDEIPKRLAAVRAFLALPEAQALAAANKRVGNILKKAGDIPAEGPGGMWDPAQLREPAERALHAALTHTVPQAQAARERGDHTAALLALAALKTPVDAFFDQVLVNSPDPVLRRNRLALLGALHRAMNQVADLSKLPG